MNQHAVIHQAEHQNAEKENALPPLLCIQTFVISFVTLPAFKQWVVVTENLAPEKS
jgi:hypothetical protein